MHKNRGTSPRTKRTGNGSAGGDCQPRAVKKIDNEIEHCRTSGIAGRRGRVDLPVAGFNQYNVPRCRHRLSIPLMPISFALSRESSQMADSLSSARTLRKLSVNLLKRKEKLPLVSSSGDLTTKLGQGEAAAHFETAVWFYSSGENDDDRIAEALSRCADNIVLLPGPGAEAARRRPQLVQCFERFGLLPDYECDLMELDPGALCLRRQPSVAPTAAPSGGSFCQT